MKASDYIVSFFADNGITHTFGYPGGMVVHLMDSFDRYRERIIAHVNYHEQASSFAACGYAQIAQKPGIAYATSGPGATNLITGICHAYFDSIPAIFITGQVNTFESKGKTGIRQKGFQETDIVSLVKPVTKYCAYIGSVDNLRYELEKAYYMATEGRPGPVVLDIPMNIQRADITPEALRRYIASAPPTPTIDLGSIKALFSCSARPCILIGAGVKISGAVESFREFATHVQIPVVSSMLAFDVLPERHEYNYGFIGAYGSRCANFILAKSDLVLALGTRLDVRQVGSKVENFAPNARLIRVDIDADELAVKRKQDELAIHADLREVLRRFLQTNSIDGSRYSAWNAVCREIKDRLSGLDEEAPNELVREISKALPDHAVITTDVGQNQVWVAQSFLVKPHQRILFSGGHGAMGHSLPAAIGAHYAGASQVISFNGDGGIQMNIQELQFIIREKLPIKVIILNNSSLGMIRHFQEMYFESNYVQTVENRGYTVPDFGAVARAYGLHYARVSAAHEISALDWTSPEAMVIEVMLSGNTHVFPKLEFGKPNQDQEPLIDRALYRYLMDL